MRSSLHTTSVFAHRSGWPLRRLSRLVTSSVVNNWTLVTWPQDKKVAPSQQLEFYPDSYRDPYWTNTAMLAAIIIIMRPFLILIPSVLFFISCQNWTADKVVQKNVHDSVTKSDQTSISPTQAHSIDQDFLAFWQKFRIAVIALDTTQIMELTQFPFQIRGARLIVIRQ